MKRSELPTDIHSIAKTGIDVLKRIQWPINDLLYYELVQDCIFSFKQTLDTLKPELRLLLLADFPFISKFIQIIHAKAISAISNREGYEVVSGPLSVEFYNPHWQKIANIFALYKKDGIIKLRIRAYAKDYIFNKHIDSLKRIFKSDSSVIGLGSLSDLKREYAIIRKVKVKNIYINEFIPEDNNYNYLPFDLLYSLESTLTNIERCFFKHFGFKSDLLKKACICWKKRMKCLYALYENVLRLGLKQEEVWITECAKNVNKIVAAGYRAKGKRAVAFNHGNAMGWFASNILPYNELASYNAFICPTKGCADSFSEDYQNSGIIKYLPVDIVSIETDFYKKLMEKMCKQDFPKKIKTVMLMGYPMNAFRYIGMPGYLFYYQLKLEIEILQFLKKNGFKVIYKIHPERQGILKNMISPFCDQVISVPFEECWNIADAYIFKYTATTTFGFALCTNRTIICLGHEKKYWRKSHSLLLSKRCKIIAAKLNNDGIQFDKNALLNALSGVTSHLNFEYVKKYMYPSKASRSSAA